MFRFTIKFKFILLIATTLLVSLSIFTYVVFNTYENDKLAYMYDIEILDLKQIETEYMLQVEKSVSVMSTDIIKKILKGREKNNRKYHVVSLKGKNPTFDQKYPIYEELIKVFNKGVSIGVQKIKVSERYCIISFLKIDNETYLVKVSEYSEVVENIKYLREKAIYVSLIVLCASLLVAILFSSSMTNKINELEKCVVAMEKQKKYFPILLDSNDEVGVLAKSFNKMAKQTFELIDEVNSYNTQLELVIKERTAGLNKSIKIQRAMMSVVSQGFFMINNKRLVVGDYSDSIKKILGMEVKNKDILDFIDFPEKKETVVKLIEMMFMEPIPFSSIVELIPREVKTDKLKVIVVEFNAIRNRENKIVALVITLTDITEKKELEKFAEKERRESRQILKLARGRRQFVSILNYTSNSISFYHEKNDYSLEDKVVFKRFLHSLKGLISMFYMDDITQYIHEVETEELKLLISDNYGEFVKDVIKKIDEFFFEFVKNREDILAIGNWRDARDVNKFSVSKLESLINEFRPLSSSLLIRKMEWALLFVGFEEIINEIEEEVQNHAFKVNKKINLKKLNHGEIRVSSSKVVELTTVLNHILKNSIDHGIESENIRSGKGKSLEGNILIESEINDESLIVKVSDDGRGIDTEVLIKKAKENGVEIDFDDINEVKNLVFKNSFSTSETLTLTSGRGVGMGAVKQIVEQLGGKIVIGVNENFNCGTMFYLKIPIRAVCNYGTYLTAAT